LIWGTIIGEILFAWYLGRYHGQLKNREDELEVYAVSLDDWDREIRVKLTALDGLLMYARRVARSDPDLQSRMDVLEVEMFHGEK
jgi:hypothetical protein